MDTLTIDLADPEYRFNPWPVYRRLRDEAPVHLVRDGTWDGEDFYVLSRYDDVSMALREKNRFSSQIRRDDMLNFPMLVNRDAPEHTRMRHMTNRSFNARLVSTLGEWVREIVDGLIADMLTKDRVDFVEAFAEPLPLRVVGGMLGVPLDRKADLRRWSGAVMDAFAVAAGLDPSLVPGFLEDLIEFGNYMEELAAERRGKPNRGDILGELVVQQEAGDMTRTELTTLAWSFVAAGHETTMNLLSGGFHLLLTDPALARRLTDDPDRTPDFAEEYLRLCSPIQWLLRRAKQDVELHGVRIGAGQLVHVLLGSANRDPRHYPDPDVFDLDRPNALDHLAFGAGPHFCPGSALSRMQVDLAFRALYPYLDRFRLDPDAQLSLWERQGSYGFAGLPVLVRR
ncbi:cytochrome P450 [Amycolatopsis sp. NPDC051716]|uniref:cytochrome P450 n=1 Tax=Amycolatopsis sp. NPDC051716 TaxID=3155804 RepID=UPI003427A950